MSQGDVIVYMGDTKIYSHSWEETEEGFLYHFRLGQTDTAEALLSRKRKLLRFTARSREKIGVVLSQKVRIIAESAFKGCTPLLWVKVSSRLQRIGKHAFYDCYELTQVRGLENTSLTAIPCGCFAHCGALREIHLPPTVRIIDVHAFFDCCVLREIHGLDQTQLQEIRYEAFACCWRLERIALPGSLHILGAEAFSGCSSLKETAGLEETRLRKIQNDCFYDCMDLKELRLPDTLKKLDASALPDDLSFLALPDAPVNITGPLPWGLEEVCCTLLSLRGILFEDGDEDLLVTLTMPDETVVSLWGVDLTEEMAEKLVQAARTGLEEDWLRAVEELLSENCFLCRRIWLLHCLAGQFLKGKALALAQETIQENRGPAIQYLYEDEEPEAAITLFRKYGNAGLDPSLLDELLELANENGDTAFAALLLQGKEDLGRPPSFERLAL